MKFDEKTRIGILYRNEPSCALIVRRIPHLQEAAPEVVSIIKSFTIEQYAQMAKDQITPDWLSETLTELADVPYVSEPEEQESLPSLDYETDEILVASAIVHAPAESERWGVYEIQFKGPNHGKPFIDVSISAEFRCEDITVRIPGFYEGEGVYRIRFMPGNQGNWTFRTFSNARSLEGINGTFRCTAPSEGNHGPVTVNGGDKLDAFVGEAVIFKAAIQVPEGTGKVVNAEWDFHGTGEFVEQSSLESPAERWKW